jgi:hypothetical protein
MKRPISLAIIIIAGLLAFSTTAGANDTDPSGRALRAYVEQYLKTAPPTDALAAEIKASGGVGESKVYERFCNIEIMATLSIGYRIWENRMRADSYYLEHFPKSQFIPLNITNYCITYSNNCGHWRWSPDCLKRKLEN